MWDCVVEEVVREDAGVYGLKVAGGWMGSGDW